LTSNKRWLTKPVWTGLFLGLLPTIGYLWAYAAQGVKHESAVLWSLYRVLFSFAEPAVFILRSLGFDIYFVEAHGPTRHTYYVWALVSASSLVFWLVFSIGIAATWKYARGRSARLNAAGEP
jgi:hypothetical protein